MQAQPTFGRQLWPFPSTSTSFYRPSELRRAQFDEQQQIIVDDFNQLSSQSSSSSSSRTHSPIPVEASTSSAQPVEESSQVKTKKARSKSADWTEEETHDLLEAWGPKYSQLRSASQKTKINIWNQIYASYKSAYPQSQRTLQHEYKLLKQKSQKTGEAGINRIKDGFPYFDYFDDVMGHRDSVDPSKMAVEGSSIFPQRAKMLHQKMEVF